MTAPGRPDHPCFNAAAASHAARLHLPVAPRCNISCNYCHRRHDCLNESRPGVCSRVISPEQALERFHACREKISGLAVAGIAGPGDALADWRHSSRTFSLIREADPDICLCLSTNGLKLPDLAGEILDLGVRHVTVTVNAVNPVIGSLIYAHVNYAGERITGLEGAELLLRRQEAGIRSLVAGGAAVKINTVMIPGVNEEEIPVIMRKYGQIGALVGNIMPFIPVKGSVFGARPPASFPVVAMMRRRCSAFLPQISHCGQCRADAAGLIGQQSRVWQVGG